ncbi:MAG: LEA type 2 family protein, partial [Cytophagaceae bacterium]
MKYSFFFFTIVLFSFSSCKPIQPLDVKEIESVTLDKLTGDVADIAIRFKLNNPNNMKFTVTSHHLDIYLNDQPIGVLVNDQEIDIPANSDKSYIAHAEASLKNITGNLPMLLGIIAKGEA